MTTADLILHRGKITTNDAPTEAEASRLNVNLELRWDGVPSLADALRMLKEQARRTPPPQRLRVVGGWNEFQFAERRMPTLDEINAAAFDTPAFVLHLYDRALLNAAALRAVGYTKDTPDPPGGEIQRDKPGNPTGILIARPNATILYATLAKGPKLPPSSQLNSTRHFMRELNRLGITSAIDAGGGYQNYPDDDAIIEDLHRRGEMTVRVAYNLFTQRPKGELVDFSKWAGMTRPGEGSDFYRMNGAGELHVFSAADAGRGVRQGGARRRPARRPGRPVGRLLPRAGRGDPGHRVGPPRGRREGRPRIGALRVARPPGPPRHAGLVAGGRLRGIFRGRRPLGRGARTLGPLRSRCGDAGPPQTAACPGPPPEQ